MSYHSLLGLREFSRESWALLAMAVEPAPTCLARFLVLQGILPGYATLGEGNVKDIRFPSHRPWRAMSACDAPPRSASCAPQFLLICVTAAHSVWFGWWLGRLPI